MEYANLSERVSRYTTIIWEIGLTVLWALNLGADDGLGVARQTKLKHWQTKDLETVDSGKND